MNSKPMKIGEEIGRYISMTMFAKCLCVSRPTLYKYLEHYKSKDIDRIPDNVLKIFDKVMNETSENELRAYFKELQSEYRRTEERRNRDSPIPADIADTIDCEDLDVRDIDKMIDKVKRRLVWVNKNDSSNKQEIEQIEKDLCDLEYTRNLVERRLSENRFLLIYSSDWMVCTGPEDSDVVDLDEETMHDCPELDSQFRFYLTRAKLGYSMFFYNDSEGDEISVQLLTGPGEDKTKNIMGTFSPEPGMKFIKIPDLFDEDWEDLFRYRILRTHNGTVLNSAIGKFTV